MTTSDVAKIVAIASGKGGVGKTTVAVNTALALAGRGLRVGLLDADLYGPDAALMLGLTRTADAEHVDVWNVAQRLAPIERHGVRLFSLQFMIGEAQDFSPHTAFARMLLDRMFGDVEWGALDVLLVDLPPGTADVQQHLVQLGVAAALIVVTPQDVAHLDARKLVTMLLRSGVRVVGGVENMASFVCTGCEQETLLYPAVSHARSIWALGIDRLASVPFSTPPTDPYLPVVVGAPHTAAAAALRSLADEVAARL